MCVAVNHYSDWWTKESFERFTGSLEFFCTSLPHLFPLWVHLMKWACVVDCQFLEEEGHTSSAGTPPPPPQHVSSPDMEVSAVRSRANSILVLHSQSTPFMYILRLITGYCSWDTHTALHARVARLSPEVTTHQGFLFGHVDTIWYRIESLLCSPRCLMNCSVNKHVCKCSHKVFMVHTVLEKPQPDTPRTRGGEERQSTEGCVPYTKQHT